MKIGFLVIKAIVAFAVAGVLTHYMYPWLSILISTFIAVLYIMKPSLSFTDEKQFNIKFKRNSVYRSLRISLFIILFLIVFVNIFVWAEAYNAPSGRATYAAPPLSVGYKIWLAVASLGITTFANAMLTELFVPLALGPTMYLEKREEIRSKEAQELQQVRTHMHAALSEQDDGQIQEGKAMSKTVQYSFTALSVAIWVAGLVNLATTIWQAATGEIDGPLVYRVGISVALIYAAFQIIVLSTPGANRERMLQLYLLIIGVLAVVNFIGISLNLDQMLGTLESRILLDFGRIENLQLWAIGVICLFFLVPFIGALYLTIKIESSFSGIGSILMLVGFLYGALFMMGISLGTNFDSMTIAGQLLITGMTATFLIAGGHMMKTYSKSTHQSPS